MATSSLVYTFLGLDAGAGAQFDRMAAKTDALGAANKRTSMSFGTLAKGAMLLGGVAAVATVKMAADYQQLITNLQTGAGESAANLKSVSSGILDMAGQVGFSANDLAKAMFTVESAGYHGAAGLRILQTSAQGAKVDNADLTTVVDALTSAMNAYHEPAANAAAVTNTLIASAAVGKMHLQDLATSLGNVLPSAAALGVPLDQIGAAFATMTMQGTDAAKASTYLRFSIAALANPTAKAQAAMQAVGITSGQVANALTHGGLTGAFGLLQTAVGSKFPQGSAKYLAALANMVGGTRGLQAVLELTGKNLTTMNQNLAAIDGRVKSAGNSVSDWAVIQQNFNQKWSEFVDGLGAGAIRIGGMLLPAATDLLGVLSGLGSAAGATFGWFTRNTDAAMALATVIGVSLIPRLLTFGATLAGGAIAKGASIIEGLIAPIADVNVSLAAMDTLAGASLLDLQVALGDLDLALAATAVDTQATAAAVAEASAAMTVMAGAADDAAVSTGALSSLTALFNPLTIAIAAAAAASVFFWKKSSADAAAGAQQASSYLSTLDMKYQSLAATQRTGTSIQTAMVHSMQDLGHNVDMAGARVGAYAKAFVANVQAQREMRSTISQLGHTYDMTSSQVHRFARAHQIALTDVQKASQAFSQAVGPTRQLAADNKTLTHAVAGSAAAIQALTNNINLLIGGPLAEHQAMAQFTTDLLAMSKAAKGNTGHINDSTKAGLANGQMLQQMAGDINGALTSWVKAGRSADYMRSHLRSMEQAVRSNMIAVTGNKAAVDRYLASMNLLPGQISKLIGAMASGTQKAGQAGAQLPRSFASAITGGISSVVHAVGSMISGAQSAAHPPTGVLAALGAAFDSGYAGGIIGSIGSVVGAVASMVSSAISAAQSKQQSHSPSRVMRKIGRDGGGGYAVGWLDTKGQVVTAANTVVQAGTDAAKKKAKYSGGEIAKAISDGLINGFKGHIAKVEGSLSKSMQKILGQLQAQFAKVQAYWDKQVKNAESKYKAELQKMHSYESGLMSSALGDSALSNVPTTQTTVTNAYTGAQTTTSHLGNVGRFLTSQRNQYRSFYADLEKAHKRGLSLALEQQIESMGPTQGLAYLQQILSGQDGSIGHLNKLQQEITRSARRSADMLGKEKYGSQVHDDRRDAREMRHEAKKQTRLLEKIADKLGTAAAAKGDVNITIDGKHIHGLVDAHLAKEIEAALKKMRRKRGG